MSGEVGSTGRVSIVKGCTVNVSFHWVNGLETGSLVRHPGAQVYIYIYVSG